MQNSTKEGKSRQYFSRDREIVPYIESHWEYIVSDDISKGLNGQIHHHVFNFVV